MAHRFNSSLSAIALGRRLRAARARKLLTQVQLGEVVGVDHGQISRIERGSFKTYSKNVQKLCTYLSIEEELAPAHADKQGDAPSRLLLRLKAFLEESPEQAALFATLLEALEVLQADRGFAQRRV
jgi:transcriptional regulator with XRE-family HTH domain